MSKITGFALPASKTQRRPLATPIVPAAKPEPAKQFINAVDEGGVQLVAPAAPPPVKQRLIIPLPGGPPSSSSAPNAPAPSPPAATSLSLGGANDADLDALAAQQLLAEYGGAGDLAAYSAKGPSGPALVIPALSPIAAHESSGSE